MLDHRPFARFALSLAMVSAVAQRASAEPALIHITGNVIFAGSSNLIMEFAGPTRGTEYDAMNVDGTIILRGTLSLERLGGYVPAFLTPHRIVAAGTRDGVFKAVNGISLSPTRSFAVTYSGPNIDVTATLPGDSDVDGDVDFDDLLILAQHYQQAGQQTWQGGDFTGDGLVNFDDLLQLAQHYHVESLNDPILEADWKLAQGIAPEPTLALIVPLAIFRLRRRR